MQTNLVAIVGSLRSQSYNRLVLDAVREIAQPSVQIGELRLESIPFFNADIEAAGDPQAVSDLKAAVAGSDGFVVFTPEYSGSFPGLVKNAIDWLSSSTEGPSALSQAAVGLVVATPGPHETEGLRSHFAAVLNANTKRYYQTSHVISSVTQRLRTDADGTVSLGGEELGELNPRPDLRHWLDDFVAFTAS